MKTKKILSLVGLQAVLAVMLGACASETPFQTEGEGLVNFKVSLNREVSRAIDSDSLAKLEDNCVVYISSEKGLLHKWKGLNNVPSSLYMKFGDYKAEAWSGDSLSASFTARFYKGATDFTVNDARANKAVVIKCGIANVVASVDASTIDNALLKDYNVTIGHSRGSLDYNADNIATAHGYYMMPSTDTDLTYTVTGKGPDGKPFTKEGVIEDVKPAWEYVLSFKFDPKENTDGGAFLTIKVEESALEEDYESIIYGCPAFAGFEFDIDSQVIGTSGEFDSDRIVAIAAYGGLKSLDMTVADKTAMNLGSDEYKLLELSDAANSELQSIGISFDGEPVIKDNLYKYYLTFSKEWLNSLVASAEEYVVTLKAVDRSGKKKDQAFRIANTEGAIKYDDPLVAQDPADNDNMMAVTGTTAEVTFIMTADSGDEVKVQYRADGTDSWNEVTATTSRAASLTVTATLTGLRPGTRYEYRGVMGDFTTPSCYVTTDEVYVIPNASFEEWGTYKASTLLGMKDVTFPGSGSRSFWDSGNEGSATVNMTLTDKSTDMVHSGTYSARLESKSAAGVIAAGNIFIGSYVKTDGTNGVLSFGREFNGSHPAALKVWANYRPASGVSIESSNKSFLPSDFVSGGTDQGQIYVALTTAPVEIRTNPSNRKLFDADGDATVLAYGEVTWKGNFGPDGSLEQVEIPLKYNSRAKSNKPAYLVVVVSASKYGDYFSGAPGSVIYLDDFELVY